MRDYAFSVTCMHIEACNTSQNIVAPGRPPSPSAIRRHLGGRRNRDRYLLFRVEITELRPFGFPICAPVPRLSQLNFTITAWVAWKLPPHTDPFHTYPSAHHHATSSRRVHEPSAVPGVLGLGCTASKCLVKFDIYNQQRSPSARAAHFQSVMQLPPNRIEASSREVPRTPKPERALLLLSSSALHLTSLHRNEHER